MELAKDILADPEANALPDDPHKTAQGGPDAPGGKGRPGQERFRPDPRPGRLPWPPRRRRKRQDRRRL